MTGSMAARLAIVMALTSPIAHATGDGWVRLSTSEVGEQSWREASPTKFLSSRLDIDGDGRNDLAAIVVSRDSKQSAIRVCFGGIPAKHKCQIIAVSENIADVMGLERKSPGCFDYIEDDAGRPSLGKKVCGRNDMLEYFKFGSASSIFVYDAKHDAFARYWDSD